MRPDQLMKVPFGRTGKVAVLILAFGAMPAFWVGGMLAGVPGRIALRSARSSFLSLHHLSWTLAAERGVPMGFVADPDTHVVAVTEGCGRDGRVLESRDFNLSYRVDIRTSATPLRLCMTPGGGADPGPGSGSASDVVTFHRDERTASVIVPTQVEADL